MTQRTILALFSRCALLPLACGTHGQSENGTESSDGGDAVAVAAFDGSASSSAAGEGAIPGHDAGTVASGGGSGGGGDGGGGAITDGGRDGSSGDAGASGYGLLADGSRDKTLWPFAVDSIWNTPIGSNATYEPAGIVQTKKNGSTTFFHTDDDVIVMAPKAPSVAVDYSAAAWTGANRCLATTTGDGGAVTVKANVLVPPGYTIGNSGGNNSAAFLASDGTTVQQNQPFTRCTADAGATTYATSKNVDITGAGITGAHGGSGLSALGGTIRLGEFGAGQIRHALKVELWAAQYYHCCSPIWPAPVVDGYASSTTYGGSNAHLGPGALLALLPTFDTSTLSTVPAQILATTLREYGAYVVDDVYANGWGLCVEQGPNGFVGDEFKSLYGSSLSQPRATDPFMADLVTLFQALHIVTNNTATTLGGGGPPLGPFAPPIGN